jgi:hypothetical protein
MAAVFRKTPKGVAEIETRAHRLAPRLRSTLIMVDGRRSVDDLRGLILGQAEEVLGALAQDGFIEALAAAPAQAPASTRAPSAAATAAPAALAAPPASGASLSRPLETVKRDAVRLLTDAMGPAAEGIALRIEKARSVEEFMPLLERATELIGSLRGGNAAVAFRSRLGV